MAPRPAVWILKFQVAPLPPPARRTDRRIPRLNPVNFCRNGRALRRVGKVAFQKTSSTIPRRPPPFGHGGDEAHTLGQAPRVEPALESARFSAGRWGSANGAAVRFLGPVRKARHKMPEHPQALRPSGDQPPRRVLPGVEGVKGGRHTEGRIASAPERPHGIWDKSACLRRQPRWVLRQESTGILLHPAPLLKSLWMPT